MTSRHTGIIYMGERWHSNTDMYPQGDSRALGLRPKNLYRLHNSSASLYCQDRARDRAPRNEKAPGSKAKTSGFQGTSFGTLENIWHDRAPGFTKEKTIKLPVACFLLGNYLALLKKPSSVLANEWSFIVIWPAFPSSRNIAGTWLQEDQIFH